MEKIWIGFTTNVGDYHLNKNIKHLGFICVYIDALNQHKVSLHLLSGGLRESFASGYETLLFEPLSSGEKVP